MEEVNNNNKVTNLIPEQLVVTGPEDWLCVAKLPLDITGDEFCDILTQFGKVKESFLVESKKTGKNIGYGFAQFSNCVAGLQARHVLDGQEVRGHQVDCDWVKEGTHTIGSLHSKVLYVDNLPSGFRDLVKFRSIFSTVVNPPYCQIAQKHGVLQDWGLVEYNTPDQAEETMSGLSDITLDGVKIRVQYCIPNIHAINIYMKFVNNPLDRVQEKKALMDETPSKDVYNQLQSLTKQNPGFVQSLNAIMKTNNISNSIDNSSKTDFNSSGQSSAVLTLLLANFLQKSPNEFPSLDNLIKQLESGTPALDILKSTLSSNDMNRPDQRPTNQNISGLISNMTNLVGGATSQQPSATLKSSCQQVNTKSPQLTNMLYSAFQANVNKQQGPALIADPVTQQDPSTDATGHPNFLSGTNKMPTCPSAQLNTSYLQTSPYLTSFQVQTPPSSLPPAYFPLNNLPHILSLPPPPPPPSELHPQDHSWQYYPQPYLMYPSVTNTASSPNLYTSSNNKRKTGDMSTNYTSDPDIGKRQKLPNGGFSIQT